MTGLEGINREEWSSVPFLLRLVGGPGDGREITWGCLPEMFWIPVPPSISDFLEGHVPINVPVVNVIGYVQTGHVADDGARLYRMRRSGRGPGRRD